MNSYITRCKNTVLDYLGKAQQTEAKITEGRSIYQAEAMEREEKRLRAELEKARKAAEEKLDAIYHEASVGAREWGQLDGAKLTADAQLLQGQGVTPDQFGQLVSKYQDNYTMLDALRKYGEKQNAAAIKEAREAGESGLVVGPYNLQSIPGPDAKQKEWDDMRRRAGHFLDIADGRGMDDFTRGFARSTADREFEAWGQEPEAPKPVDHDAVQKAFRDAWGFVKDDE